MDIRPLSLLLPLGLALAACNNPEPVADGDVGRDAPTVPADATGGRDSDAAGDTASVPATGTGSVPGGTVDPTVAGGSPHATEAESVAIDATGHGARDAAASDVAGAEAVTRDDSVNPYDRAPQAADALEGKYNDEEKDKGD